MIGGDWERYIRLGWKRRGKAVEDWGRLGTLHQERGEDVVGGWVGNKRKNLWFFKMIELEEGGMEQNWFDSRTVFSCSFVWFHALLFFCVEPRSFYFSPVWNLRCLFVCLFVVLLGIEPRSLVCSGVEPRLLNCNSSGWNPGCFFVVLLGGTQVVCCSSQWNPRSLLFFQVEPKLSVLLSGTKVVCCSSEWNQSSKLFFWVEPKLPVCSSEWNPGCLSFIWVEPRLLFLV